MTAKTVCSQRRSSLSGDTCHQGPAPTQGGVWGGAGPPRLLTTPHPHPAQQRSPGPCPVLTPSAGLRWSSSQSCKGLCLQTSKTLSPRVTLGKGDGGGPPRSVGLWGSTRRPGPSEDRDRPSGLFRAAPTQGPALPDNLFPTRRVGKSQSEFLLL